MTDTTAVGIVLVSHSSTLAAGLAELAGQIGSDVVPIAAAGGTDDGRLGTSIAKIEEAVRRVDRGAGVLLLPDLGSAVLTARALLAEADDLPVPIAIADAPFVEGAVAAVVTAAGGADLEKVLAAAEEARNVHKL